MRIHTDLQPSDLDAIIRKLNLSGVYVGDVSVHGSRKRTRRLDVSLAGHSISGGAYGNLSYTTATWDEWGLFIHELYEMDATAIVGPYVDRAHFDAVTCDRFPNLLPQDMCKRHRWKNIGPYHFECPKCGAEMSTRRPTITTPNTIGTEYVR